MYTILKDIFGYTDFRPLQKEAIELVLQKKDAFVLMPTGGGKSLCYQIPALKFAWLTLVISPLISLMKDQVDALRKNGAAAAYWNSSLSSEQMILLEQEVNEGKIKILYLSPERLALADFQAFLKKQNISLIAIDEAHCISEWGHDFRPDYKTLTHLKEWFPNTPLIALTATATKQVQQDIVRLLNIPSAKVFQSSFERKNLELRVLPKRDTFQKLLHLLEGYRGKSVIIYCFSRKETEEIAQKLNQNGYKSLSYHAGLAGEVRAKNQELFITDEVDVMVATIAFGMGIDKPDVRLVVHYTYPKSLENYYQEIGRAGRDGLPSQCVLFFTHADTQKHMYFINQTENEEEREREEKKLRDCIRYAESQNCRTYNILQYFDENTDEKKCGHCDNCLDIKELFDATEITQKILSAVIRTKNSFGITYIVQLLCGSSNQNILKNGHDQLPVYGIVSDFSRESLKQLVQSLIDTGLLCLSESQYPVLQITDKGIVFLREKETIELPKPKIQDFHIQEGDIEEIPPHLQTFEALRILRKQLADKEHVPPFVIFSDVSLKEMATYLPQTPEEFLSISGVGQQKLTSFGEIFLSHIRELIELHQLTPQPLVRTKTISRTTKTPRSTKPNTKKGWQVTKELLEKETPLEDMANLQGITQGTVIAHIEKLFAAEEPISISYLRPEEKIYSDIKEAFISLETTRLSPIFSQFEGQYTYEQIRLVRMFLGQTDNI